MSQVIFYATDWYLSGGYGSYRDLFELVSLAGYPVKPLSQIDRMSDDIHIVTPVNGEWNMWPKRYTKGRLILLQLEWNIDGQHHVPECVDETWCADKHHAELHGYRYVPLGSDDRLNILTHNGLDKPYDVSQFAYQTARRQIVTQQLIQEGLRLTPNENLWGMERSTKLSQSKLCVHVHQTEGGRGVAPLRWCLAAAHHLPILTEAVDNPGIFTPGKMIQADYGSVAKMAANVIREGFCEEFAGALHDLLCRELTFKKSIERAL